MRNTLMFKSSLKSAVFILLSASTVVDFDIQSSAHAQEDAIAANIEFLTELRKIHREYRLWIPVSEAGGDISNAGLAANFHKMYLVQQLIKKSASKPVDREIIEFCERMIAHADQSEKVAAEYLEINLEGIEAMKDAVKKNGADFESGLAEGILEGFNALYKAQRPLKQLVEIHKTQIGYFKEWQKIVAKVGQKYRQSEELRKLTAKPNAAFPLAWIVTPKMVWSEANPGATKKRPIQVGSVIKPKGYQIPSKSRSWRYFFKFKTTQRQGENVTIKIKGNEGEVEVWLHDPTYRPLIKQAGTSDARKVMGAKPGEEKAITLKLKKGYYYYEIRHYYKPRFGKLHRDSGAEVIIWRGDADTLPENITLKELKDKSPKSKR